MIFTLLSRKVGRGTRPTPQRDSRLYPEIYTPDGDITAQPFHAAGPYWKDNKPRGRYIRLVSSYSSALAHSRPGSSSEDDGPTTSLGL